MPMYFPPAAGGGFSSYTWTGKPSAATAGAGTEIDITDVGTSRSRWYSDGTNWRPVNGLVVLKQIGGSVATPAATFTGSTGGAQVTLPGGNLLIPAGLLLPGSILVIQSMERLSTVDVDSMARYLRIGTTGGVFGDSVAQASTFGPNNMTFSSDFRLSVASSSVLTTGDYAGRNVSTFGALSDLSTNINTAANMYLAVEAYLPHAADIYQLISLTVRLYQ